jgi:uncharacterized membrane protein YdjX (TVP38/TMEM64 family)
VARLKNVKLLIIAGLVFAVGTGFQFLPVREWLIRFQDYIDHFGPLGPIVFALIYVVLTIFLIPGSALTLGAGAIFGLWRGAVTVIIGANLGALCSFMLARTFLRNKVEQWAKGNPKFDALDSAIGREGFKMVLLSRLSPVFPFTLLNYLLGLTKVRVKTYVLANLIGMLPGTFLYVYLGATARGALTGSSGLIVKAIGLAATIAVVALITRTARRALARAEWENINRDININTSEAK